MTTFLLVVILIGISAVAVLIIYLIDRVNTLQRFTRLLQTDVPERSADRDSEGPFAGLSGRDLWGAVSGEAVDGWDETSVELIRKRYQLVLRRHIESLFQDGFRNAQAGVQMIPTATYTIQTLRGTIESWIPIEYALAIYKAGSDRAKLAEDKLPQIRSALDGATEALHTAAKLKLSQAMSDHLIPPTEAELAARAVESAANAGALPAAGASASASAAAATGASAPLPSPALAAPDKAAQATATAAPEADKQSVAPDNRAAQPVKNRPARA